MSVAQLLRDLGARGIQLSAAGERLHYAPASKMTPELVEQLRTYKPELLALLGRLEQEGFIEQPGGADAAHAPACDRCGCTEFRDITIHGGQSTRRECARCHRFLGFPRWYGQES